MALPNITQAAKNRSTGPKTPQGKARAALNSVKWGLNAKNLLMLGEDEAEYERRANAVFEACAPENAAQAEIVALIFDVMWRLGERAPRIEKALFAAEGEELLMAIGPSIAATKMEPVMVELGRAIEAWERQPRPTELDGDLLTRANKLESALLEVSNVDEVPIEVIGELHERLTLVMGSTTVKKDAMPEGLASLLLDIAHRARVIMTALLDLARREEALQDAQRKAVGTLSLPNNEDLKKLARYTAMLELSLTRRLNSLDQLRKLRPAEPATSETNERSREFLLKLRVVK